MTAPERIFLLPDDGWSWVEGPKPPYEENAIEYVRADLSARPDAPDVRVVTVAQLDRWLGCLVSLEIKDEILALIGEKK